MSSIVLLVLKIFQKKIVAGSAWTVDEIWQSVRDDYPQIDFEFGYDQSVKFADVDYARPQEWLIATLQNLSELGLVSQAENSEESSGFPRWRIGNSWSPPEPLPGNGSGGGGGVRDDAAAGNDDGVNDGGGLREALGHPVLFALPQADFDELVEGLFEAV